MEALAKFLQIWILKVCLKSVLVPETCGPAHPTSLAETASLWWWLQDAVSSRREGPFPTSGSRAPNLLQQHLQTSLQREALAAFCRELPAGPVLAQARRLCSDMVRRGHLLRHWQPAAQLCSTAESGTGWQIQFIMPCESLSQGECLQGCE